MNATDVRKIPGTSRREAAELAAAENAAFIAELTALAPDAWNGSTDCDPWTVKDIASHVLGWGEAGMSWREFRHQMAGAVKGWRAHGNPVHAQNQLQVEDRKDLSPDELIARLEVGLPALLRLRQRLSLPGRLVPLYNPLFGLITLGFAMDTIFTRDVFVHRIDIARSAGTEFYAGPHDRRVFEDCLRHWAKKSKANLCFELDGPLSGHYATGSAPAAVVRGTGVDLVRVLAGRLEPERMEIEGEKERAVAWLRVPCPF